jgi:SAM-dependent methyltransferase
MLTLEEQNQLRDAYRERIPGWRPATEVFADLVRAYITPQTRVLDLGCGRGGLVEQLDLPAAHLFGIDADWHSLAEHRLADLPRAVAETTALPLAAGQFDVALGSWLFEHLDTPAQTLAQVRRVLRPGGVLVFITPNSRHPLALLNRLFGRLETVQGFLVERLYGRAPADTFPTRYLANSRRQLDALAHAADLDLIRLQVIPDPTYLALRPELFRGACLLEENLPASRRIHLVGVLRRPRERT